MLVAMALAIADSEDDAELLPSFLFEVSNEHLNAYVSEFSEDAIENLSVRGSIDKMEKFVASRHCDQLSKAYKNWAEEIHKESGKLRKTLETLKENMSTDTQEAINRVSKALSNDEESTGHNVFEIRRCIALAERRHPQSRPELEQFLREIENIGLNAVTRFMKKRAIPS